MERLSTLRRVNDFYEHEDTALRDAFERVALEARSELLDAVQGSEAIPGVRPYRLATVDELLDAWEAFNGDVDGFITAWNDYTEGKDFPCPNVAHGVHDVTDGSCNNCGSKNRT